MLKLTIKKAVNTMDIATMTQVISNVGFPIACCIYFAYLNKITSDRHIEEVKHFTTAIENNTQALTALQNEIKLLKN
jgi:hypothetical protein